MSAVPEYLTFRCCMCPNINKPAALVCPGIPGSLHPDEELCRFVKIYEDERGWRYFVRAQVGLHSYRTFYLKAGQSGNGRSYKTLPWQGSFDKAQADLNALAARKHWKEVIN